MSHTSLEQFLSRRFGFDPGTLGPKAVEEALRARMADRKIQSVAEYVRILTHDPDEPQAMVERLVIPETWFFRYPVSFEHMIGFLQNAWFKRFPGLRPRILSVPCSTGEEPYTIAMAMIASGIPEHKVQIDAVDISRNSLSIARRGRYGRNSFRGNDLAFRDRFFTPVGDEFQIRTQVRDCVKLLADNLLSPGFVERHGVYDVVFCRNLLIYFDEASRKQAAQVLSSILSRTGVMYLGHAENMAMVDQGFSLLEGPHAFACVRPDADLGPGMVVKSSKAPSKSEGSRSGSGIGASMGGAAGTSAARPAVREPSGKPNTAPPGKQSEPKQGESKRSDPKPGETRSGKPKPAESAPPTRSGSSGVYGMPAQSIGSDRSRGPGSAGADNNSQSRISLTPTAAGPIAGAEPDSKPKALAPLEEVRQLADQGMITQALESCQKILSEKGPSADAFCMLGILLQAQARNKDAEVAFNKALYLDHQHYEALLHLSLLYEKIGEERMAENLMRRAKRVGKK